VAARAFHLYLEARFYSRYTIVSYMHNLRSFIAFCNDNHVYNWDIVEPDHVKKYLRQKHKEGISGRSLHVHLSSIRQYFRYLFRFHGGNGSQRIPTDGVTAPKAGKHLSVVLSVKQIQYLLDTSHIEKLDDNEGSVKKDLLYRDAAIFEVLYGAGLRLAELISLNISDINWPEKTLFITGKGNKQRLAYFGTMAERALKVWLAIRAKMAKPQEQAVFVSSQGGRLSCRTVQQRLKKWGKDKACGVPLHPHLFRHTFATHILESSGDIIAVQHLLGHASITTTQIYLHVNFDHLAKVYDKAHPRAKRKKTALPLASQRGRSRSRFRDEPPVVIFF